jgi:glutamyl-Q tRNA(Asp) synthetase
MTAKQINGWSRTETRTSKNGLASITFHPGACVGRLRQLVSGMSIRSRFAPSPTGRLHLGHVFAATVARAIARDSPDGTFVLRFEDIDAPRVREDYYQGIEEDLQWLGLDWDEPALRQSTRLHAYEEALSTLQGRGLVYPCFCTRREIQRELESMASAPQGPEGPLYPGICRKIDPATSQARIRAGEPYSFRLDSHLARMATGPLSFHDLRFGNIAVDPNLLGDVILARKDIGTAYHLAVVVDDAFQQISHVTRGEDLLPSTHVHRILQNLLHLPEPVYLHHRLILDTNGKRLAKRCDPLSIAAMRKSGLTPEEVLGSLQELP